MTKGMRLAVLAHVLRMVIALAAAWYLPTLIWNAEEVRPAQYALTVAISVWGLWTLRQIVRRKDAKSDKIIEHFDR